jgi:hypothetical protein
MKEADISKNKFHEENCEIEIFRLIKIKLRDLQVSQIMECIE